MGTRLTACSVQLSVSGRKSQLMAHPLRWFRSFGLSASCKYLNAPKYNRQTEIETWSNWRRNSAFRPPTRRCCRETWPWHLSGSVVSLPSCFILSSDPTSVHFCYTRWLMCSLACHSGSKWSWWSRSTWCLHWWYVHFGSRYRVRWCGLHDLCRWYLWTKPSWIDHRIYRCPSWWELRLSCTLSDMSNWD